MVDKHKAQLKKLDCDAGDDYNFTNNTNFYISRSTNSFITSMIPTSNGKLFGFTLISL